MPKGHPTLWMTLQLFYFRRASGRHPEDTRPAAGTAKGWIWWGEAPPDLPAAVIRCSE
jgi:hypothetical protein